MYPRERPAGFHPLRLLSRLFDCVEINSSFYAIPSPRHAARWVDLIRDRPAFRFTAKVHQEFSHGQARPRSEWRALASSFRAGLAPIVEAARLGVLLLQFPHSFRRTPDAVRRLAGIVPVLREVFTPEEAPIVVELRHRSWWAPDALAGLSNLGCSLAWIDLPAARDHPPPDHDPTGPIGYLRLHGRNAANWFRAGAGRDDRYDYLYGPEEVREQARRARSIAARTDETYVVTNNHFEGQAVANAIELRALLSGERQEAPPELIARYPRLAEVARPARQGRLFGPGGAS